MKVLNIPSQPNIEFQTEQKGVAWSIHLYVISNGALMADFTKNGTVVLSGIQCPAGAPLITFPRLAQDGNFAFITDDIKSYPDWQQFGKTHKFVYLEPGEELNYYGI